MFVKAQQAHINVKRESRMQFRDEKKRFLDYFKPGMMKFLDEKKLLLTTTNQA